MSARSLHSHQKKRHSHVTQSNHTNSLPNAESNTRSDTTVQSFDAVAFVDVLECFSDRQILGSVWVIGLALHLHPNDFDGLIPRRQTTTEGAGDDLFKATELLSLLLVGHFPNGRLGQSGETESRSPVGGLADRDRVDALVDASDAFLSVDVGKGLEGRRGFHALRGQLVLGYLHRLHAGAETHGRVRLGDTADHATGDARNKVVGSKRLGVVLCLGGDEEEDGTLCRGFDPGPGDETLVVYFRTSD